MEHRICACAIVFTVLLTIVTSLTSPPKIVVPDKKITEILHNKVAHTLQCTAEGEPAPTYKWTVNGKDITSPNIQVDGSTGTLTISEFTDDEEGNYQCIAENEISAGKKAVGMSAVITLKRARFDGSWPDSTDIRSEHNEGDYVKLTCDNHPNSVPTAQYSWYLAEGDQSEGEVQTSDRIYVDEEGSLHFMYITKEDENGQLRYKCGMYNSELNIIRLGSEKDVVVQQAVGGLPQLPPVLKFQTSPATFLITKDAELECVFSGIPIPEITWYKNKVEITNSEKYEILADTSNRKMIVKNIEEADEALYVCKGESGVGKAEGNIYLDVTSGPIWDQSLSSQTVVEGKDAVFTCKARQAVGDDPLNEPQWFQNGDPLPATNTGKFEFSESKTTLTIKNLNKATDITCFQCNVSNDIGYEFADGCLNIIEPIVVTTLPELEQVVEMGGIVNLTVIGTTDPDMTLEYRWRFKNVTYEFDNPPHVIYNKTTHEAHINTSALTDEEFKSINGTYYRELYHKYENKVVEIHVTLHIPDPPIAVVGADVSLWWLPIIIALLVIIILVLIIACVLCWARERGTYPLDKKERANDMDPEKDLADGGFHELSRAPGDDDYLGKSPLVNPNFDYDDDDGNPERDDESLEAYAGADSDMARFNEDGSFIGQYTSKKK